MAFINIGSFNINVCRDTTKRPALFKYLHLKKADIILLQDIHSDLQSQKKWNCDWKGDILMSPNNQPNSNI